MVGVVVERELRAKKEREKFVLRVLLIPTYILLNSYAPTAGADYAVGIPPIREGI